MRHGMTAWLAGVALAALTGAPAAAQVTTDQTTPQGSTPTGAATPTTGAGAEGGDADAGQSGDTGKEVLVTGSRIKQDPNNSALPLQIITTRDLSREGISSPEQLISFLAVNGNGADNLASNSDVVSGAQRGTNGLSAANLRGQGAASTLVLLNGRRVAAHGLQGSAVDVNQIPFAALDRVEVLKSGASAIYGTDAVGGVINFITRKDFTGIDVAGFTDTTEAGDAPIYRVSATTGFGDLASQHFNVMGSVSKSWNGVLYGHDRAFVNGNQPNRGLSIDTRGTPIATAFPINPTATGVGITQRGTLLGGTTGATLLSGLVIPGTTTLANGGINVLNLPGGAGCGSFDGGMAYDYQLWSNPGARYACAYDTGRAAVLQQPIQTLTFYGRATARFGRHELFAEVTGSDADSAKRFSENQYTANATSLPIAYPLNDLTRDTYNSVYNQLVAVFPAIAANYGKPITFRYRCIACGVRAYDTTAKTFRGAVGAEGPLFGSWEYRAGASYADSMANSTLGGGYQYTGVYTTTIAGTAGSTAGIPGAVVGGPDPRAPTAPGATAPGIVGLFNSGILNPFSLTQSAQALAGLQAVSALGTVLYGGKYDVYQADGSVSGKLFRLPGGTVQLAAGVDYRREGYRFNGSAAAAAAQPAIFNAAFDNVNALAGVHRDVKAAYAELSVPILKPLEVSAAFRVDDYTGFGTTTNPEVTAKLRPTPWLLLRGQYNTGFRVPTFNQIYNGVTQSPNPGNTRVDPSTCAQGTVNSAIPGCAAITPDSLTGGNLNLGPETSTEYGGGIVLQPSAHLSASADFWSIAVDNTIGALTIDQLLANYQYFKDRIIRTNGVITLLDLRSDNIGSRRTQGIDFAAHGDIGLGGGRLAAGFDGTLLLKKREKFLPSAPYGPSEIGLFTLTGDLGLKWKHNVYVTWANDRVNLSVSQIFRNGYRNQALPGIANGTVTRPDYNPEVDSYILYNATAGVRLERNMNLTFGIRNIFNTDPPFAVTYDSNSGAGSSWEPRVADPRGRSFTVSAEVRY